MKRKTYIYDLDNTLIDTSAKVIVRNCKKFIVGFLTSNEYNKLNSIEGDNDVRYDYSQFRTLSYLTMEPKTFLFDEMRKNYEDGHNIYIITARPTQHIIWKWLTKNKVCIDKRNVLCYKSIRESVAAFKSKVLNNILSKEESSEYHVYEDDEYNISYMSQEIVKSSKLHNTQMVKFYLASGTGLSFNVKEL